MHYNCLSAPAGSIHAAPFFLRQELKPGTLQQARAEAAARKSAAPDAACRFELAPCEGMRKPAHAAAGMEESPTSTSKDERRRDDRAATTASTSAPVRSALGMPACTLLCCALTCLGRTACRATYALDHPLCSWSPV